MSSSKALTVSPASAPDRKLDLDVRRGLFEFTDLDTAMRVANLMSTSELVPKEYFKRPDNILVAIQMGAEVGLKPMQSLQNIKVINGKPSVYGTVGKALLLAHGFGIDEANLDEIKQTGIARCTIKRPDGQVFTQKFTKEMAVTAKLWGKAGPWTDYPERMLSWRAFWFCAKDGAADVLHGLRGAEEEQDHEPIEMGPIVVMPRSVDALPASPPKSDDLPAAAQPIAATDSADSSDEFLQRIDGATKVAELDQLEAQMKALGITTKDHPAVVALRTKRKKFFLEMP